MTSFIVVIVVVYLIAMFVDKLNSSPSRPLNKEEADELRSQYPSHYKKDSLSYLDDKGTNKNLIDSDYVYDGDKPEKDKRISMDMKKDLVLERDRLSEETGKTKREIMEEALDQYVKNHK